MIALLNACVSLQNKNHKKGIRKKIICHFNPSKKISLKKQIKRIDVHRVIRNIHFECAYNARDFEHKQKHYAAKTLRYEMQNKKP